MMPHKTKLASSLNLISNYESEFRGKDDFQQMKDSSTEFSNIKHEGNQSTKDYVLSLFRLSSLEIVIACLTGITTWIGFRNILQKTLPYPYDITYEESWTNLGQPLFSLFIIPGVLILSLSAVSLFRAIRKDERHFSRLGNLALAWPLVAFPLLNLLSFFSLYCLPVGTGIALIATLKSTNKENSGDWITLVVSIAWLFVGFIYFGQWWDYYGD